MARSLSLCLSCARPVGHCDYLMNSRLNQPEFIPGSEHTERKVCSWRAGENELALYIITKCPMYVQPVENSHQERKRTKVPKEPHFMTDEERKELYDLYIKGVSKLELQKAFNVCESTVMRLVKKMEKKHEHGGAND